MTSRELAYRILKDIESKGEYSNLSINKNLRKSDLDIRDKSLVTEIVYGVIEKRLFIDNIINKVSKIKVKKMSHSVKIVLEIAVYEIFWLDGVKDYASINEAVNLIKKFDKKSSGFVNGVLRNICRRKEELYNIEEDSIDGISIKYSFEKWIVKKLIEEYGRERAREIIIFLSNKPRIFVRVNLKKKVELGIREDEEFISYVMGKLENQGVSAKRTVLPECIEVSGLNNIENNDLFMNGIISIQDISSMMVANVVNPSGDERVLDLCSAPGGKSTHVAEKLSSGCVVSCDVFGHKLELVKKYSKRLGLDNMSVVKNDALILNKDFMDRFDVVLVDAPCSGMGIVRRKPEIKYKKKNDVKKLPEIQLKILENAAKYVSKDGVLIYSTCTIFNDENMGVIMKFMMNNSDFSLEEIGNIDVFKEEGQSGYINILPDKYDMDGFFICKMRKKRVE